MPKIDVSQRGVAALISHMVAFHTEDECEKFLGCALVAYFSVRAENDADSLARIERFVASVRNAVSETIGAPDLKMDFFMMRKVVAEAGALNGKS